MPKGVRRKGKLSEWFGGITKIGIKQQERQGKVLEEREKAASGEETEEEKKKRLAKEKEARRKAALKRLRNSFTNGK